MSRGNLTDLRSFLRGNKSSNIILNPNILENMTTTYKDITIFELNRRIKLLQEARSDIFSYYNKISSLDFIDGPIDNPNSLILREKINYHLSEISKFVDQTNTPSSVIYSPPPNIGGAIMNIEFFDNLFNLQRFGIHYQNVLDAIDQAIGIYQKDKRSASLRTFNPFWWLGIILKKLLHFPFYILTKAGFDSSKFENSFFGKSLKLVFAIITFAIVVITFLGYQEAISSYIKVFFHLP